MSARRIATPYTTNYKIRVLIGVSIFVTYQFVFLFVFKTLFDLPFFLVDNRIFDDLQSHATAALFFVLWTWIGIALLATILVSYYFFLTRLVGSFFAGVHTVDLALTLWARRFSQEQIVVYRSGWSRTFSTSHFLRSGGAIYLGVEAVTLSQHALSFVLHHEIAHITARGSRWRRTTTLLLIAIDSFNDLRSGESILVERRIPKLKAGRAGVMRDLNVIDLPLAAGLLWTPIKIVGAILSLVEVPLGWTLGSLIRTEEFFADSRAASELGDLSRKAMIECAFCFSRIAGNSRGMAQVSALALQSWVANGSQAAIATLKQCFCFLPIQAPVRTWYPSWKERVMALPEAGSRPKLTLPMETPDDLPISERIILDSDSISIRGNAYLHPIIAAITLWFVAVAVSQLLLVALGIITQNDFGLTPESIVYLPFQIPVVGLLLLLTEMFLSGEEHFVLRRSGMVGSTIPADTTSGQWLVIDLSRSIRSRLVFAFFPSPICLIGLGAGDLLPMNAIRFKNQVRRRLFKLRGTDRIALLNAFHYSDERGLTLRHLWPYHDAGVRRDRLRVRLSRVKKTWAVPGTGG